MMWEILVGSKHRGEELTWVENVISPLLLWNPSFWSPFMKHRQARQPITRSIVTAISDKFYRGGGDG